MPIFSSCRPTTSPGVPPSTRNAVSPRAPGGRIGPRPDDEHPRDVAARDPLLLAVEAPSGRRGARRACASAAASLPACGSESAEGAREPLARGEPREVPALAAPRVPKRAMVSATMFVTADGHRDARSPRPAISIIASAYATAPGLGAAVRRRHVHREEPELARASRTSSAGNRPARSFSAATGAMRSRANRRAVSCDRALELGRLEVHGRRASPSAARSR